MSFVQSECEALHETTMGTSLYQLYDGTIKLFGTKKLLWHRVGIEEQKTVTRSGEETTLAAKGRHDPCVLPRAVPMVEAMILPSRSNFPYSLPSCVRDW